ELADWRIERQLILFAALEYIGIIIEFTERSDRRQDRGHPAKLLDEGIAQRAGGTTGRDIDGRFRQAQRVGAVAGKSGDKAALKKRFGKCGQKRRARGDRKNPGRHCVRASAMAASAGAMASGVPTVIQ